MKPSTGIRWYNKEKSSDMQQPTGFANFTASDKSDQLLQQICGSHTTKVAYTVTNTNRNCGIHFNSK